MIVPALAPQDIQKVLHLLFPRRAVIRSGYGDSVNPL
jgi:hypothetical protein